jgi:hypothetical protein
MQDDQTRIDGVCRRCGSREAGAAEDARALGLLEDFLAGNYTCCQIVQWADEQWTAWLEAAREDRKAAEEVTRPLEIEAETDAPCVPVRVKKQKLEKDPNA